MDYKKLLEIGIKKRNKEISDSWSDLAHKYSEGLFSDGESFRLWVKNRVNSKSNEISGSADVAEGYKSGIELHKDGTQSSNKLIKMTLTQEKDPDYLLKAHGYDIDTWELITAKANEWNVYSKTDGISTLYSSKISVKPKVSVFSIDRLIESFKNIKPFTLPEKSKENGSRLLEVSLFDMHWGISDFEYYQNSYHNIAEKIKSRKWDQILFTVGQDNFHNDNHRGQTSSGTMIESVDMEKAWKDASDFYTGLITLADEYSDHVKVIYSKGNHDESLSWAFVKYLNALFPSIEFDDRMIERKVHVYGDNFIGITHGDKGRKNLHNIFPIEFPLEWASAKNREIHIGHLHVEDAKDVFGMVIRTLSTRNKTDKWHRDNGYVGAHKRFMLFEYSKENLESIHYV